MSCEAIATDGIRLGANTMGDPTIELLCKNCGRTFTAFLKEMADKNAEVTCPECIKVRRSDTAMPRAPNQ